MDFQNNYLDKITIFVLFSKPMKEQQINLRGYNI